MENRERRKKFMKYHLMNKVIRIKMSVQGREIYESFMKKVQELQNHESFKQKCMNYIIMNGL